MADDDAIFFPKILFTRPLGNSTARYDVVDHQVCIQEMEG
jgi:hypothetical protein